MRNEELRTKNSKWCSGFKRLSAILDSSFLIPHSSFLPPHSSFLIPHSSFLPPHSSFLIPHSSFLIPHSSFLIPHSSFLIPHSDISFATFRPAPLSLGCVKVWLRKPQTHRGRRCV